MKYLSLIKSSFHDIRCCDETTSAVNAPATGWRAQASSLTCVLANGSNTGYVNVGTLEEYTLSTGIATGNTKSNVNSDPDFIANYIDTAMCSTQVNTPSYGYNSITNYVEAKGDVDITFPSGDLNGDTTDINRSVVPNSSDTFSAVPTAEAHVTASMHEVSSNTFVDFVLVVDAQAYPSVNGTVSIVNVTLPSSIQIRPVGYVPPAPLQVQ